MYRSSLKIIASLVVASLVPCPGFAAEQSNSQSSSTGFTVAQLNDRMNSAEQALFSRQELDNLQQKKKVDAVTQWNQIALEAIKVAGTTPPQATRILAILQSAVFEGVRGATVLLGTDNSPDASIAAAAAAYRVLATFFPTQQATFDAALNEALAQQSNLSRRAKFKTVGNNAGTAAINLRKNDGSDAVVPFTPGTEPGDWQPTPAGFAAALLPQWGNVDTFVVADPTDFYVDGTPDLSSEEWATAFNEVKKYSAGFHAVPAGTPAKEETNIANFWADGKGTYTPPGHWNQIAAIVSGQFNMSLLQKAHLFSILNMAMADAAIICWGIKFAVDFWRPITAIRNADLDGNAQTVADPTWTPLIATPPFPDYMSGHSTFSGTAATILNFFFGNKTKFTVGSITPNNLVRSFDSFDAAAEEAALSRLYGGIHFRFSNEDGMAVGKRIGETVLNAFFPLYRPKQVINRWLDIFSRFRRTNSDAFSEISKILKRRAQQGPLYQPIPVPAPTPAPTPAPQQTGRRVTGR